MRDLREESKNRALLDKHAAAGYLAGVDPLFASLSLTLNVCLSLHINLIILMIYGFDILPKSDCY